MISFEVRLAMRPEGHFWNAYLALPGTMEGALLIGSIHLGPVENDGDLKDRFRELMQDIIGAVAANIGADVLGWQPPTPADERSGSA